MSKPIHIVVFGKPEPGGSKQSFVPINKKTGQPFRRANGGIVVSTVDTNRKVRGWRSMVSDAAVTAMAGRELIDGPCMLTVDFYMPRPKWHFGKSGLRSSAPRYPTTRPDATKLLRSTEDAMRGIVWRDDSQVVRQNVCKWYADHKPAQCEIVITDLSRG